MNFAAIIAVLTALLSDAISGELSLEGQWISEDSVYHQQNIFQIRQGGPASRPVSYSRDSSPLFEDLTVYRVTDSGSSFDRWTTARLISNGTNVYRLISDSAISDLFVGHVKNDGETIEWDLIPPWNRMPKIEKVHVVFMNHLDVGYDGIYPVTGFIVDVLNRYFQEYFSRAINLAKVIKQWNSKLSFIYTTHPWLVSLYLDCPNMVLNRQVLECPEKEEVDVLIDAIKSGYIAMHAGAMNMQYGMMNSDTVVASVQMVKNIYQQLGIDHSPRVLSLRDVPGLTKNSLNALSSAGVKVISVGVNPGTSPPAVPKLFQWSPDILGMWHKGGYPLNPGPSLTNAGGISYGDCLIIPDQQVALAFSFRTDNSGPPCSLSEIEQTFVILEEQFPGAEIMASTLDRFYDEVLSEVNNLPNMTSEIGDTWLQGIQSDPRKVAEYRSLQKAYSDCIASTNCDHTDPRVQNALRFMIKLPEHTWGLPGVSDNIHWSNEEFYKVLYKQNFQDGKNSWLEQRIFTNMTLEALGTHPLAKMMLDELKKTKPTHMPIMDCKKLSVSNPVYDFTVNNTMLHIQFDEMNGFLSGLEVSSKGKWLIKNAPFGQIVYYTYNETDFSNFAMQYDYYGNAGFDKPNSTINADPVSGRWYTKPVGFYYCSPATFVVHMEMKDDLSHTYYGAPSQFWMNYTFVDYDSLVIELQWVNKTATRLGEATMFEFYLPSAVEKNIMILYDKDNKASIFDVVLNGSQLQHGGYGIETEHFTIHSHHTQLICPIPSIEGQPTPFAAPLSPIIQASGVAFNLHNNIWNTNYPLWYPLIDEDADFKATFTAKLLSQP